MGNVNGHSIKYLRSFDSYLLVDFIRFPKKIKISHQNQINYTSVENAHCSRNSLKIIVNTSTFKMQAWRGVSSNVVQIKSLI